MTRWRDLSEEGKFGMFVIAMTIIVIITLWFGSRSWKREHAEYMERMKTENDAKAKALYGGWVKQTGNPQKITMEEFFALQEFKLLKGDK